MAAIPARQWMMAVLCDILALAAMVLVGILALSALIVLCGSRLSVQMPAPMPAEAAMPPSAASR